MNIHLIMCLCMTVCLHSCMQSFMCMCVMAREFRKDHRTYREIKRTPVQLHLPVLHLLYEIERAWETSADLLTPPPLPIIYISKQVCILLLMQNVPESSRVEQTSHPALWSMGFPIANIAKIPMLAYISNKFLHKPLIIVIQVFVWVKVFS